MTLLHPGTVVLLGLPSDVNSSFLRGPARAPERIRAALHSGSMNLCAENGADLGAEPRFLDLGDVDLEDSPTALRQIEDEVRGLLARGARTLCLGGDHSISYPILRAYAAAYPDLNILHLDAHPDLYDKYEGSRTSHACPFARVMEEKLAARLVQVGIRTMNPHQQAQADRFGVQVVNMERWQSRPALSFEGPVYLSLDMDVLDPAYAPGVSHHEPGGLSTREVIQIIHDLRAPLVGADLVELNPERDLMGVTAMVAAKLLKEIAAVLLADSRSAT